MKQKIYDIFRWLGCLLLIVCGLGLVLAFIGLVFKYDSLYFLGLILASPLFVIGLPFCLLVLGLMFFGSIYKIVSCSSSVFQKSRSGCKTGEATKEI